MEMKGYYIMLCYIPDGHHAEGNVARRHVVGAFNLVNLVAFSHDDAVVLEDDGVGEHARHGLGVTVAAVHGQVQPEAVAILDVDVASFTAAKSVNAAAKGPVGFNENLDLGITTMNSDYKDNKIEI